MRLLPLVFLMVLAGPLLAQGPAQAPKGGEKHIYKTVGGVELPLYVFAPEAHTPASRSAAIVFFFGGGWRNGSPTQFEEHCKHLAKRGMVAITVEYRVSSRHPVKLEDCVADARSAMRWVRGNARKLGVDPDRIASAGGSAGGHLAAAVALIDAFDEPGEDRAISARPDAMVLFNPALALGPRQEGRTHGPVEKVSPLAFAAARQPPCLMFFGTADKLLAGAEDFRERSTAAGNQCRIVTYDDQGHGFFNLDRENGKYYRLTVTEMDRFLVSLGYLKKPGKDH